MAAIAIAVAGCSASTVPAHPAPPTVDAQGPSAPQQGTVPPAAPRPGQPQLAADPAQVADDLVHDEQTLRNRLSSEAELMGASRRQQKAYRELAQHPEWDVIVRPRIPGPLLDVYDRNIDARRQLGAMGRGKSTLPAWRIHAPPPADELLGYYRAAEAASGVGWNYLAAINFVETAFGRISGVSTAGAQGPMQFLPSTFATYGAGGDISSPHDSIMAAGRFLAAHGFGRDRDGAVYRYNNSYQYVRAIDQYATLIAQDPSAFAGFYRWRCTTSRSPVTSFCRSATPRPHPSRSRSTWRPTLSRWLLDDEDRDLPVVFVWYSA